MDASRQHTLQHVNATRCRRCATHLCACCAGAAAHSAGRATRQRRRRAAAATAAAALLLLSLAVRVRLRCILLLLLLLVRCILRVLLRLRRRHLRAPVVVTRCVKTQTQHTRAHESVNRACGNARARVPFAAPARMPPGLAP
jgi:hypothetical protein